MEGWIKTHRKLMDSQIWQNPVGLKIWMWCLFKASHQDKEILIGRKKVLIKAGQFIYGRMAAAEELEQSPSTVRNWVDFLKQDNYIDIKSSNKYSVVTIVNWTEYQQMDIKVDNTRTTPGQHQDTNKNIYNIYTVNNRAKPSVFETKKTGTTDMADALLATLEKKKATGPGRNQPEWMRHALEVAEKLKIDWKHPELVQENIKVRWFSLFKKMSWGKLQSAYSFCFDYPNKPDSAGLVKLFFWAVSENGRQLKSQN